MPTSATFINMSGTCCPKEVRAKSQDSRRLNDSVLNWCFDSQLALMKAGGHFSMRKIAILLGTILAIATINVAAAQGTVTVNLAAIGSSGVSGTATLTANGANTDIGVNLTGEPAGASE